MNDEQFNEILSYLMVIALNTTVQLSQQSQQKRLTRDDVGRCQSNLLQMAQGIQERLAKRSLSPDLPPFGRADS